MVLERAYRERKNRKSGMNRPRRRIRNLRQTSFWPLPRQWPQQKGQRRSGESTKIASFQFCLPHLYCRTVRRHWTHDSIDCTKRGALRATPRTYEVRWIRSFPAKLAWTTFNISAQIAAQQMKKMLVNRLQPRERYDK